MAKYNKQYIVVKSQYVPHILQYTAIRFWHIVTALQKWEATYLMLWVEIREKTIYIRILLLQPKSASSIENDKI